MRRAMPLLHAPLLSSLCALLCASCLAPGNPIQARVIVYWDPVSCGAPHRVGVDLEDDSGAQLTPSAPCEAGELAVDVPHLGEYRGWIYAHALGETAHVVASIELAVDTVVVRFPIETPR